MVESRHELDRAFCHGCFECVAECYPKALEVIGKTLTVEQVFEEVLKDVPFYEESGGGLTLSGGEPMAQFAFTRALVEAARGHGLHTCLESSGIGTVEQWQSLAPLLDWVLFDYKETVPARHRAYTGADREPILANLFALDATGVSFVLRCPLIPGLNFRADHLEGIATLARSLAHCQGVHLLAYHPLGESKRTRLGLPTDGAGYPIRLLSRDEAEHAAAAIRSLGYANVSVY